MVQLSNVLYNFKMIGHPAIIECMAVASLLPLTVVSAC